MDYNRTTTDEERLTLLIAQAEQREQDLINHRLDLKSQLDSVKRQLDAERARLREFRAEADR